MNSNMARVIFICDGCGLQADGTFGPMCEAYKPRDWYARLDAAGDRKVQIACSRRCIDIVAAKSGKTNLVLSI